MTVALGVYLTRRTNEICHTEARGLLNRLTVAMANTLLRHGET